MDKAAFLLDDIRFKDIIRLKNHAFYPNRISSIVGKSGSGKTTLLKMLNKSIIQDRGEIYYFGVNLKDIKALELRNNAR